MKSELAAFFDSAVPAINDALDRRLPPLTAPPEKIHEAMRYSVLAGGKRLRPALCVAGYALFRPEWNRVVPAACSLEMIHTYSLIHDDLPAMDDDDFRRGIPACHKKFGEAIAILAGDALLTLAFESLARVEGFAPDRMLGAVRMLGRASGTQSGMIAGQVFDLESEGRDIKQVELERIHRSKTGALITTSVEIGAYLGDASDDEQRAVTAFGERIGLVFQIVDDILDETSSSDQLGKTVGKDRSQRKATYPAMHGLEKSRAMVAELTEQARQELKPFGQRADILIALADYLGTRSH